MSDTTHEFLPGTNQLATAGIASFRTELKKQRRSIDFELLKLEVPDASAWLKRTDRLSESETNGEIFSIDHDGIDYFPTYLLDSSQEYRPYAAVKKILAILKRSDGWGAAFWFASVNGFLGGKRPIDLLADEPDNVIAAAEDEAMGINHA